MKLFHAVRNAADYPLRQLFRWRRRGLRFPNEPKDDLFADLDEPERADAEARADRLLRTYHLDLLWGDSPRRNYRLNLYYLELLERAFDEGGVALSDPTRVVDIGPSHWFYVQALHGLLRWWQAPAGRDVSLTGHELDAFRVYHNLYSRWDHALAHIRGVPGIHYRPTAFEPQRGGYDLVLMLFPFVFDRDHLRWGLPWTRFRPEHLLAQAWLSVAPGGALVVVNQGEAEHDEERRLFAQVGVPVHAAFAHVSPLYLHALTRWAVVARRG